MADQAKLDSNAPIHEGASQAHADDVNPVILQQAQQMLNGPLTDQQYNDFVALLTANPSLANRLSQLPAAPQADPRVTAVLQDAAPAPQQTITVTANTESVSPDQTSALTQAVQELNKGVSAMANAVASLPDAVGREVSSALHGKEAVEQAAGSFEQQPLTRLTERLRGQPANRGR